MGGYGSGRKPNDGLRRTDDCIKLSAMRLKQQGCLKPRWVGGYRWPEIGEKGAEVRLNRVPDGITLEYAVGSGTGDFRPMRAKITIDECPCNYGGRRPYFLCPGEERGQTCGRRVAYLYCKGGLFRCRHCHGLSYRCQIEGQIQRSHRRTARIMGRLQVPLETGRLLPPRPKGMWRRTYDRAVDGLAEEAIIIDMILEG